MVKSIPSFPWPDAIFTADIETMSKYIHR